MGELQALMLQAQAPRQVQVALATSVLHHATSTRSEFSRLFGYRPDVSQKKQHTSRKRKFPRGTFSSQKRARISTWKKETVCLRYKDQTKAPDTLEKMELAKLGLGLKELSLDADDDAMHIHGVLLEAFKELAHCGGYTLL